MMADPQPTMLEAALQAWDAGLCVIRARNDGTKRPETAWTQYQAQRPTRQQVAQWFADGYPAMGSVTGAVSGDLEMLELEGRFVTEQGTKAFADAMKAAGLELLLKRLTSSLVTISPSDGRHLIYQVDGHVDGNTKLAVRPSTAAELAANPKAPTQTLIETRGEGGFIMLAPSHGAAHPTGKAWRIGKGGYGSIPRVSAEERDALFAVARTFDHPDAHQPVTPPAPTRHTTIRPHTGTVGSSWYDAAENHLKASTTVRGLLEAHGWQYEYTDRHGRDMLKRPGKDTDGISGAINTSGRLIVFSTSTPFESYSGPGKLTPTYNELDVLAMYEHGNDRRAAARAVAESAGILDAYKRAKDAETHAPIHPDRPTNINADGEVTAPEDTPDDSLWLERECLTHILHAARTRLVSPYAVLGCVLARIAAFTPPNVCLPPLIGGGTAPLSVYIALRGKSGAGKSSPVSCATDLLPETPPGCVGPLALGSGEGLVEAYMELTEETDGGGKKTKVKRQTRNGALFILDEGQMLAEIGNRKGSTILPVLRTAWSGGDPGQANASIETRRSLKAGTYTLGLISLWQDVAGAQLLDDADGGTPQRFVWMPTNDPGAALDGYTWPGRLHWDIPDKIAIGGVIGHTPLAVHPDILTEVRTARLLTLHGKLEENPLDAHRRLNKLKIAGCLTLLDNRRDISPDDWRIAERILTVSDQQRDWVLAESRRKAADKVSATIAQAVLKEGAVEQSAAARALRNAAKAAWRAVDAATEPVGKRAVSRRIAGRDRVYVTADDAIAEAVRLGWIAGSDDAGYQPGKVSPT